MKKIIYAVLFAAVCCGVFSCNEKPTHYKFVQVATDGSEKVEDIAAKNDTDALKQYISRMEKILIASVVKGEEPDITMMYIISPTGDTLNTNKELLDAVSKDLPVMQAPAESEASEGSAVPEAAKS